MNQIGGSPACGAKPSSAMINPPCMGHLRQAIAVLALVTGHQRQIDVLIEVAHMGLRDIDLAREVGVNLAVGGVVVLPPPANANEHIVAVSGASKGNALGFRRQQAQLGACTRGVRAVTRAAGD